MAGVKLSHIITGQFRNAGGRRERREGRKERKKKSRSRRRKDSKYNEAKSKKIKTQLGR